MHVAPSQEFTLLCDVPGCDAALSMVAGVPREDHGWGRMSFYRENQAIDYDLCLEHSKKVTEALGGQILDKDRDADLGTC